jgi:STE24 endopeptidase
MMKILVMVLIGISYLYFVLLNCLSQSQNGKPLPANVSDVFDEERYKTFISYTSAKRKLSLIQESLKMLIIEFLFGFDVFKYLSSFIQVDSMYKSGLFILILYTASTLIDLPFSYIDSMVIEKKYGFGKSSIGTFVSDSIAGYLIGGIIVAGVVFILSNLYGKIGNWIVLFAVGFASLLLFLISGSGLTFMKIFNKFTPMPDSPLKKRLSDLFTSSGYHLKDIYVMNASKRTSKSNAFCTGLGKMKSIAIFDNLLNAMTEDEIVAVFAHELCHYRKKDTLHMTLLNILVIGLFLLLLLPFIYQPDLAVPFGFASAVDFGLIFLILAEAFAPIYFSIAGIFTSAFSRHCEYRADQAAKEAGLGSALASGLKKMAQKDLADLNPHPWIVYTSYSHPTISQRIEALNHPPRGSVKIYDEHF